MKMFRPIYIYYSYFVTYDLVSDTTGQQRIEWDKRFARCVSQQEIGLFCLSLFVISYDWLAMQY